MTIYWLVDTAPARIPTGILSAAEQTQYQSLQNPKRQQDWWAGRWTMKRLLQEVVGATPEISKHTDGSPYVPLYPRLQVSMSHSEQVAFCAAAWDQAIGADIEQVASRSAAFIEDYFTPHERMWLATISDDLHAVGSTLLWSAKESLLKALRLGLRLDTRLIEVSVKHLRPSSEWQPLTYHYDEIHSAKGWWRQWGNFLLTLAVLD